MTDRKIVYLDHAATSWPKPPSVLSAMNHFLTEIGANPGRSGHSQSVEAARVVFRARERLARFFGLADSERVIFTANATHALNLTIHGLLADGGHVLVTGMEHNSVIRPIRFLERRGVSCSVVPCDACGYPDLDALERGFESDTRLVVATHGSNVSGTVLPIDEIGHRCRARGVPFLVDAAQTAGVLPLDLAKQPIDFLAVTGHKGLLGPPGIGCLCLNRGMSLPPLLQGGTGSRSDREYQPDFLPDALEAGTLNSVGIAGLTAAIEAIEDHGMNALHKRETQLTRRLVGALATIPGVSVIGPRADANRLGVVSIQLRGLSPSRVGLILDRDFGIMTRVGLHCAPLAHKTLGTFPQGTVRLSLGWSTTAEQIDWTIDAVRQIAQAPPQRKEHHEDR